MNSGRLEVAKTEAHKWSETVLASQNVKCVLRMMMSCAVDVDGSETLFSSVWYTPITLSIQKRHSLDTR